MPYTFKRSFHPLINTDALDILNEEGQHVIQATQCRDVPDSVLVAFSRDNGRTWYGYHKNSAHTLDEFQARFEEETDGDPDQG